MSSVGKPTTCKDAIRRWEEENGQEASTATEITLSFQWPPIEKMDNSLAILSNCEKISLSTNMIEKIAGISSLKNLKILSLGRNLIKGLTGIEALGETLEELWISYNLIEKMKGIQGMRNLRILYMSNNLVREWNEFSKMSELPNLRELLFVGNPLCDGGEADGWKMEVARRLPNLEKLDGEPIIRSEEGTQQISKSESSPQSSKPSEPIVTQ
ncbi:dynein axonemal light chain 1-like [Leptopilina heterotoma]|uniref:dynein axonemal light chain 1-like n=1 Tax=Leptopilina heterotoma TaxID=63436 RepID=UPI001CAA3FE7|nr:dynein axonemal light chain 1-like [Leptopilina heterotoma]